MNKPNLKIFLWVLLLVIISYFLVHIFAFFGVFIAFAFPLWWILMPRQTPCFLCQAMAEGDKCPFCQRIITKKEQMGPRNLKSAVANGALLLVFSIASVGLVYGESQLLINFGVFPMAKTVSFVIPTKGQYRLGEVFPMKVEIAGNKTQINAVQADIGFEPAKLKVEDVTTEGSFADIFIQKEINNDGGYVRLTGGLTNPGFSGDRGVFGTVYFKGLVPGLVKVSYLPSSMVLANDKKGTNVLKNLASMSYLILPERITPEEEKSQKQVNLTSSILGETTDETQMIFYEEEKQVLGKESMGQVEEKAKINVFSSLINVLGSIDRAILSFWQKFIDIFT
jgi:ribosomal protein S18